MGLVLSTGSAVAREALYRPFGDLLVLGRQSIHLTPVELLDMLTNCGFDIGHVSADTLRLDNETRTGLEIGKGEWVSDIEFFRLLKTENVSNLDHNDEEGAQIVLDLNEPAPCELRDRFDTILDGGTLDNIFNPAQGLKNACMMLKPNGRFITFNLYSNHYDPYTIMSPQWFIDYFAMNNFKNCHIYLTCHIKSQTIEVYTPDLTRLKRGHGINNFRPTEITNVVGIWAIAEKDADSTWDVSPSQRIYRSKKEWDRYDATIDKFIMNPRPYVFHSEGSPEASVAPSSGYIFVDEHGKLGG